MQRRLSGRDASVIDERNSCTVEFRNRGVEETRASFRVQCRIEECESCQGMQIPGDRVLFPANAPSITHD